MKKAFIPIALAVLMSACSGSADVDAQAALPGTWQCDDDVELVLNPNGSYEWHALYDDDFQISVADNEMIKVTDRGHVLLGKWRISGDRLELDMLGETENFALNFRSATAVRLSGPETYGCEKE